MGAPSVAARASLPTGAVGKRRWVTLASSSSVLSVFPSLSAGRPRSPQRAPRPLAWSREVHHRGVPQLLVVHHSPTAATRALTDSVVSGCRDDAVHAGLDPGTEVEVRVLEALAFARGEAGPDDLLAADGYLLGTPANFGYMSGALKHVFDSTFLRVGGALDADGAPAGGDGPGRATARRPYGLYLHGRYDLTGAVRSVQSVAGALGWRQAFEVVGVVGDTTQADRARAHELGATIAALLTG